MSLVVSNLDLVIFAVPLLGLLLSAYFRVHELAKKPSRPVAHRRYASGSDENGIPLCLDPDGKAPGRIH